MIHIFVSTWLLLCFAIPLTQLTLYAQSRHASALPEDLSVWLKVPPPKDFSDPWYVANYDTQHEWQVDIKNGRPVAHLKKTNQQVKSILPFVLKRDTKMPGELQAYKVRDGWLLGFNAGEWGGSLWWYSANGKQRYRISYDQITQFLPTKRGLFALEGLAHMSLSFGQIIEIRRDKKGHWTSSRFVDLGHAPYVGVVDSAGNFIVSTTHNVIEVHPDKIQNVLLPVVFWSCFYPRSIALGPSGDIYLGMRHGVVRIHAVNFTYTADWLLPNKDFVNARQQD